MFENILKDFLKIRFDFFLPVPNLQTDKTNSFKSKSSDIDGKQYNSSRSYFDLVFSSIRLSELGNFFSLNFASIRKELIFIKVHLLITENH